jgi:hypothetical protein
MKNYSVSSALSKVRGSVSVQGTTVNVEGQVGLSMLGALDYLHSHGYRVVYPRV